MELTKVAIKRLNMALNITRIRGPLLCDLLGRCTLYSESKKNEKKICVLNFQDVSREGSGATACFYEVNRDGTLDESQKKYMNYEALIQGIKFKLKKK